MSGPDQILLLLRARQYDEAMPLIKRGLREQFTETARAVTGWKGFFANSEEARESIPFFEWVYRKMCTVAGEESGAAMAAADNLASMLGSVDRVEEAVALREKVFAHVRGRFAPDDERYIAVREGLVFLYRRTGLDARAEELYEDLGLCEHLAPAAKALRESGVKLASLCRPWSENCHLWAYFDAVLDCEGLLASLRLDGCVRIHDHRGTHDGSERGLVCEVHYDGVMGRHPTSG
jgi:hypothetical protein